MGPETLARTLLGGPAALPAPLGARCRASCGAVFRLAGGCGGGAPSIV